MRSASMAAAALALAACSHAPQEWYVYVQCACVVADGGVVYGLSPYSTCAADEPSCSPTFASDCERALSQSGCLPPASGGHISSGCSVQPPPESNDGCQAD